MDPYALAISSHIVATENTSDYSASEITGFMQMNGASAIQVQLNQQIPIAKKWDMYQLKQRMTE